MSYFDFHSLLSPFDFERLVRDLLEIREAPLAFRSYKPGPDGGIDIKCINADKKIIGQVKLHNPNNFNQLKVSLLKEIDKVKRINPERYILAVGQSLSPRQVETLMQLFEGYIKSEEDILDKEQINKYLGQKSYGDIVKNHAKLLVPNIGVLEDIISSIVNKDIYTRTVRELKSIKENQKLYHNTEVGIKALEQLQKNRVLIITGNPGVGKTTLARILVSNLLVLESSEFYYTGSIEEIDQLFNYDKKQVFFIDDFWGQQFEEIPNTRNYLTHFTKLLNDVQSSSKHCLILTSRSYIVKSIFKKCETETLRVLNWNDFRLDLKSYTEEDKVRIFLNHLAYFNFNDSYFNCLLHDKTLEYIISRSDYNPRHIEFFVRYVFDYQNENEYNFLNLFEKYLDNPFQFWEKIFEKQSPTAQTILLVLFISSEPIAFPELKKTFLSVQSFVRMKLNLAVQPLDFENEIKILEELFLNIELSAYSENPLITFQSPGIKDFLLEYLRKQMDTWGEALIAGAIYFNQLIFAFSTEEDIDILDYETEYSVYGKKIILSAQNKITLKQKLLSEFHQLHISTPKEREYMEGFSMFDSLEDLKYWKLLELYNFFDIDLNENIDVRNFIFDQVLLDLNFDSETGFISKKSMEYLPELLKIINNYISLDPDKLLSGFHSNIRFITGFLAFYEFKKMFPDEFSSYLEKNNTQIKEEIKENIFDDIDYFEANEMDELDDLLDYQISEVCNLYGIKITRSFKETVEEFAQRELYLPNLKKARKIEKKRSGKTENENFESNIKFKPTKFSTIVKEYIIEDNIDVRDPKKVISNLCSDEKIRQKLLIEYLKKKPLTEYFFSDIYSLSALHDFVKETDYDFKNTSFGFLDAFVKFRIETVDFPNKATLFELLESLAFDKFIYKISNLRFEDFNKLLADHNIEKINAYNFFPLLIESNKQFTLLNKSIVNYLLINKANRIKNVEELSAFMAEILCGDEYDGKNLLQLLEESNPENFNVFISNEFEGFTRNINEENDRGKVLSLLRYFKSTFDLCWNKKKKEFEEDSSSQSGWILELILQYKGVDISVMDWSFYFLTDFHTPEICKKYNIEKKQYNSLYQRIVSTLKPYENIRIGYDDRAFHFFDIDLYEFALDDENYRILKSLGFEKYMLNLFNSIIEIIGQK